MKLINGLSIMLEGWNTPAGGTRIGLRGRLIIMVVRADATVDHNLNEISEVLWAEPDEVKRMMNGRGNGKIK